MNYSCKIKLHFHSCWYRGIRGCKANLYPRLFFKRGGGGGGSSSIKILQTNGLLFKKVFSNSSLVSWFSIPRAFGLQTKTFYKLLVSRYKRVLLLFYYVCSFSISTVCTFALLKVLKTTCLFSWNVGYIC